MWFYLFNEFVYKIRVQNYKKKPKVQKKFAYFEKNMYLCRLFCVNMR